MCEMCDLPLRSGRRECEASAYSSTIMLIVEALAYGIDRLFYLTLLQNIHNLQTQLWSRVLSHNLSLFLFHTSIAHNTYQKENNISALHYNKPNIDKCILYLCVSIAQILHQKFYVERAVAQCILMHGGVFVMKCIPRGLLAFLQYCVPRTLCTVRGNVFKKSLG